MKRYIATLLMVVSCFAAHVAAEDMFVWKKINNTVPITGARDMLLFYKRAGKTQKKKLSEIQLIQIDGLTDFNKAEKLMNPQLDKDGDETEPKPKPKPKPAEAVKAYDEAWKAAKLKWHKHLINCRRLRALDAACKIDRAVEEWLMLVNACGESAESLKASPSHPGSSEANEMAIALLEVKLERTENEKLIIVIGGILDILRDSDETDEEENRFSGVESVGFVERRDGSPLFEKALINVPEP